MSEQPTIIKKFNSAAAFLNWARNAPCCWNRSLASRKTDDPKWSGTRNFEEAYKLALYGWEDGLEKLVEALKNAEKVKPSTNLPARDRYDVAGYRPHPARASAGNPLSMIRARPKNLKKTKPVLKMRVNLSYPHCINTNEVISWGASISSYINALETIGYSVELKAVIENKPSNREYEDEAPSTSMQFPLKQAGEPLSISKIIFWMAHPSACRRISFSAQERLDIERWYGDGYGISHKVTEPEKGTLDLSYKDAGHSIEESLNNIQTKHNEALRLVNSQLKTTLKFKKKTL